MSGAIDLSGIPIADAHCHGWQRDKLLAHRTESFLDRTTLMGTCLISSDSDPDELAARIGPQTDSTLYAMALQRRLAKHLDCAGDREALGVARASRVDADSQGYLQGLWKDAGITELFIDEGYPQPTIPVEEIEWNAATKVHRVARLEPWIEAHMQSAGSFDELEAAVRADANKAIDEGAIAFKSIIAYRTGLDITNPSSGETNSAWTNWRDADFADSRSVSKPVRDRLFRSLVEVAGERDVPVHIHCGGGDPEIVLGHARPQDLYPLLFEYSRQPFVLIHAGWPWTEEAAYVASILPNVYLETSIMMSWSSLAIDQKLQVLFGVAPTSKLLYGSDEASEPEVIWFSAVVARQAIARVLQLAVDRDWIEEGDVGDVAAGYLGGNARRLHGVG